MNDYNHRSLVDTIKKAKIMMQRSEYGVEYVVVQYTNARYAILSIDSAILNAMEIIWREEG